MFLQTGVTPAAAAPSRISYVVVAHPDDEWSGWSLVTGSTGNYKVFIIMTRGEETGACTTGSTNGTDGRYWYEGPDSPVGQPDYAEINPLGTGGNPWQGQWTSACSNARRYATRRFLLDRAAKDSAIPSGLSYLGRFEFSGNTRAGIPPQRNDGGNVYTSNSAVAYSSSNGMGTVIFFDLGDADLTAEEVEWAVLAVKKNKSALGIPTDLPDYNGIAASFRNAVYSDCEAYDHRDHKAVHVAFFNYDMNIGRQYGRTCTTDPDRYRTDSLTSAEHGGNWEMSGSTRIGPGRRRYGWVVDGIWTSTKVCETNCSFSRTQAFWSTFS
jgi:hypothetical protein